MCSSYFLLLSEKNFPNLEGNKSWRRKSSFSPRNDQPATHSPACWVWSNHELASFFVNPETSLEREFSKSADCSVGGPVVVSRYSLVVTLQDLLSGEGDSPSLLSPGLPLSRWTDGNTANISWREKEEILENTLYCISFSEPT